MGWGPTNLGAQIKGTAEPLQSQHCIYIYIYMMLLERENIKEGIF